MKGPQILIIILLSLAASDGMAQPAQSAGPPRPPSSPRASAPIDLTGQWVAIVNEDWRWRMVTPPKGDYASVPMNEAARKVADAWDPSKDGACEAFGAPALMRMPTRLRIGWENDTTLTIETDAGQQTRRFFFDRSRRPAGPPTLQGHSIAEWERPTTGRGRGAAGAPPPQGGSLKVVTTHLRPGWLRRNGVPYSGNAVLTEYFDRFTAPNGDEWLVVTAILNDPTYLTTEFVTSSHFKREADGSKWSPSPCRSL